MKEPTCLLRNLKLKFLNILQNTCFLKSFFLRVILKKQLQKFLKVQIEASGPCSGSRNAKPPRADSGFTGDWDTQPPWDTKALIQSRTRGQRPGRARRQGASISPSAGPITAQRGHAPAWAGHNAKVAPELLLLRVSTLTLDYPIGRQVMASCDF